MPSPVLAEQGIAAVASMPMTSSISCRARSGSALTASYSAANAVWNSEPGLVVDRAALRRLTYPEFAPVQIGRMPS